MRILSSILCGCVGLGGWLLGCAPGDGTEDTTPGEAPRGQARSALDAPDPTLSAEGPIHGQMAVKFGADLAARLRAHLESGLPFSDFGFPDDLASANEAHGVTSMSPLFGAELSDEALRGRIRDLVRAGRQIDPDIALPHLERIFLVEMSPEAAPVRAAALLARSPDVEYAEPFFRGQLAQTTPPDPMFSVQWAPRLIDAPGAWDFASGAGQAIAILDSGIDRQHPDLATQVDAIGWDACTQVPVAPTDGIGHGTHVAGITGAEWSSSTGIAGMAPGATLHSVNILDTQSATNPRCISAAFARATQVSTIANASFGLLATSWVIEDVVQAAHALDVVVAAAAGNENSLRMITPGNIERAITVGAVDENDARAAYSNTGVKLDVAAPGGSLNATLSSSVYSSLPNATWGVLSGTSMATPHVTGLAALLRELHPGWSVEQLRSLIRLGARDANQGTLPGFDEEMGHGRIDANASVSLAQSSVPPPTANITSPKYEQCVRGKTHIHGYSDVAPPDTGTYKLSFSSSLQGSYTIISTGALNGSTPGERYLGTVAPGSFPGTGRYYLKLTTTDDITGITATDYNEIEVCGGCAQLPFPPVAFWRFDRAYGFAFDSVGTNHGVYMNDAGPGPNGRVNDGLGVFGTSLDYMIAQVAMAPTFYTMSVQAWIRRADGREAVIASYSYDGVHGWEIGTYSPGSIYFAENLHDGNVHVVTSTYATNAYEWAHVAAVVESGPSAIAPIKLRIYRNGALEGATSYTVSSQLTLGWPQRAYRVGNATSIVPWVTPTGFLGNIDEVQVFEHALTAADVAASAAAKCGGNCL